MNQTIKKLNRVALIGVGMIGGSFILSLKKSNLVNYVIGVDTNQQHLEDALTNHVIDEALSIDQLSNLDAIIIATPVSSTKKIFSALQNLPSVKDILIIDVGSTKSSIIKNASDVFGQPPKHYIPSHPIAGREFTGVNYALDDLFKNHKVIITPHQNINQDSLEYTIQLWQACGAYVDIMDAKQHDRILAATSHLPHILAYSLVDSIVNCPEKESIFSYAAGGFKSFTRTASSNPIMWRDICIENRNEILDWLDQYQADLEKIKHMIEKGEADKIEAIFSNAKHLRDNHLVNEPL